MNRSFLETNITGLAIILILYFYTRRSSKESRSALLLNRTMYYICASIVCDIVYYFVNGKSFAGAAVILYIAMTFYFLSLTLATLFWWRYVDIDLFGDRPIAKIWLLLQAVPAIIISVLTLASAFTGWIFYVNADNEYTRGELYILQPILTYVYIAASALIALVKRHREILPEQKTRCLKTCVYCLLPAAGSLIQVLFYGMNTVTPAVVIAAMLLYIDSIMQDFAKDPLTKLYNRRYFFDYLKAKIKAADNDNLHLIFLDLDGFKMINDVYGHPSGDSALVMLSNAIREVFNSTGAFMLRYGGDEFAVILNCTDASARNYLLQLEAALSLASADLPYRLSASAGWARYGTDGISTPDDLVRVADANMYDSKQKRKCGKI